MVANQPTAKKITASVVNAKLDDHLQRHVDVYDPMLKNHKDLLVGEKGDDGICGDIRLIKATIKRIENIETAIFLAVLTAIIVSLVK